MLDNFKGIKYFTEKEKWGDPKKINRLLLQKLDVFRELARVPVIVTEGYATTGHEPNSQHYQGTAVDAYFGKNVHPHEFLLCALKSRFTGVGLYQIRDTYYYHLDVRPKQPESPADMWIGVLGGPKIEYVPFSSLTYQKYILEALSWI